VAGQVSNRWHRSTDLFRAGFVADRPAPGARPRTAGRSRGSRRPCLSWLGAVGPVKALRAPAARPLRATAGRSQDEAEPLSLAQGARGRQHSFMPLRLSDGIASDRAARSEWAAGAGRTRHSGAPGSTAVLGAVVPGSRTGSGRAEGERKVQFQPGVHRAWGREGTCWAVGSASGIAVRERRIMEPIPGSFRARISASMTDLSLAGRSQEPHRALAGPIVHRPWRSSG
jgi:hypothetical protein